MMTRKMRNNFLIVLTAILVIVSVAGSLQFFNRKILRSDVPDWLQTIVELFAPPADLYAPLAKVSVGELSGDNLITIVFQPKYRGRHAIAIVFRGLTNEHYFAARDKSWISADIVCKAKRGRMWLIDDMQGAPFIEKYGGGFTFGSFFVPNDLPLDENVDCKIKLHAIDQNNITKYGPAEISVSKMSDA